MTSDNETTAGPAAGTLNGMLTLYNSLTRTKERFEPIDPANVRMYVCGPTVYDDAHIGNARPAIVFDVLFRVLRRLYGPDHVTYVRNITDVEDKINARAAREYPGEDLNAAIRKLTERTEARYREDVTSLGCLSPNVEPRATEHIAEMTALIETLVERGFAYVAEDHVLFSVASMPAYGSLSRRSSDDMIAGARVEVAPYKRDPMDFVLWKPSAEGEPGWPSPAGIVVNGRPGWHLECSAMSAKHLGQVFDIHGGGIDLIFPHHENEIAQSCCAHGTGEMARYWMHNGFVQVEGHKMSKSLGNFVTIHDLLTTEKFGGKRWPGEVLRLAMLTSHYRQPIDWTVQLLTQAERTLGRWYDRLAGLGDAGLEETGDGPLPEGVANALLDDLNTPEAIGAIHALAGERDDAELVRAARFLGLLQMSPEAWAGYRAEDLAIDRAEIERLIAARIEARAAKDYAAADGIRDQLVAKGIQIMDARDPATGALTTSWDIRR